MSNPRQKADELMQSMAAEIEDVLEDADNTQNFFTALQWEVEGKLVDDPWNESFRWVLDRLRRGM